MLQSQRSIWSWHMSVSQLKVYAGTCFCLCDSVVALSWIRTESFHPQSSFDNPAIDDEVAVFFHVFETSIHSIRSAFPNELNWILGFQIDWSTAVPYKKCILELRARALLIQSPLSPRTNEVWCDNTVVRKIICWILIVDIQLEVVI